MERLVLADLTGFEKIEVFDDCDQLIDFAFVVEEVHGDPDPAMSDGGQHSVVVKRLIDEIAIQTRMME